MNTKDNEFWNPHDMPESLTNSIEKYINKEIGLGIRSWLRDCSIELKVTPKGAFIAVWTECGMKKRRLSRVSPLFKAFERELVSARYPTEGVYK